MIIEKASLLVRPGQEKEFEKAFSKARSIISSMPGFLELSLARSTDMSHAYLLIVKWRRLEDHTEGFRGSDQYKAWSKLLHHFYDPFPTVEYYQPVNEP